jgi:hypothetical protein
VSINQLVDTATAPSQLLHDGLERTYAWIEQQVRRNSAQDSMATRFLR